MGLTDYRSGVSRRLGREAVETLQNAEEALPKDIESIELKDLSGVADTTSKRRRRRNRIEDHLWSANWRGLGRLDQRRSGRSLGGHDEIEGRAR